MNNNIRTIRSIQGQLSRLKIKMLYRDNGKKSFIRNDLSIHKQIMIDELEEIKQILERLIMGEIYE